MIRRRPLLLVAVLVLTAACGSNTYIAPSPTTPAAQPDPGSAAAALASFVDALDGRPVGRLSTAESAALANAKEIGISSVSMRYIDTADVPAEDGSWTGEVMVSWRVGTQPAAEEQIGVTFAPTPIKGVAAVARFGSPSRPVPLWLLKPVKVVHRGPVTVIADGRDPDTYVDMAQTAITQVRQSMPWPDAELTVEVPHDGATLEQVLGVATGTERGVAAFTGPVDARPQGPIHIFVNPDVIGSGRDAQIVLTHEAVHAATSAATNTHLPPWLREGFADYVALRAQDLPLSLTADRALATVKKSGAPSRLPSDDDFNSQAEDFGEEYQFAWLACRYLGELGGPTRLYGFYTDVASGTAVDAALLRAYGLSTGALTSRWREYLARLAG